MKSLLILIFVFDICLSEEKLKTEVECKCRLRLSSGQTLEKLKLSEDSTLSLSDKCDRKDFDVCAEGCNQKISNDTNGYDLDKPKAGQQNDLSLGQLYCNQIGSDVNGAQFLLLVTLECDIEKEIKEERNGTLVTIGTSFAESSITRYVESGFKQKLRCVDNKYTKTE